jgi:O-antigen/teichoic acid export membrane protein
MSLRKQALSGMIWTYSQQFGSQIVSFGVSVVLARLILPAEFGLIGMLAIFMGISSAFFEGGLTSSLIRSKDIDEQDYATVFIFNFIGSIVVYALLFIGAPYIALFYHQPILINITRIYGLNFIFLAFGTVQNTLLTRELKFKKQALISLPALLLSSGVGLIMAYCGYGVWSLVFSALVNSLFVSVLLWWTSEWKPKVLFDKYKFKIHFNYGYKMTLSAILDTLFTNIYQIIIGRFYAPAQVGFYTRANTLMMLPVGNVSTALNRVVFPLFSQVQDDIPRFRNAYRQIMQLVLFIITPIIVTMALLAEPLIIFLFTDKWLAVVPIFKIICFTGVLYPLHVYNLLVLQVKGRSDLFLRLEIVKKIILSLILFVSFFYGFYALLWGQLLFSIIALFINTHYAGTMLEYSMIEQLKDIFPIFFFAAGMGIVIFFIDREFYLYGNFSRLVISGFFGISSYLLISWIFKFEAIETVKNLIGKR